jgi:hypothetical protein
MPAAMAAVSLRFVEEEMDRSLDVPKHGAPFLYRQPEPVQAIVEDDHGREFAGDVGGRRAHRNPEIGSLESRTIIHAVARHADHEARLLKRSNDP